jgi:N4-gp56 family major capsid protein
MAVDNFVPEVWAAELLTALRNRLVYAQPGIINRDYEGEVAQAGDTVHITSVADPSVASYTPHSTTITYSALSDSDLTLTVDQSKYFAFKVEDIERRQALPGFVEQAAAGAAYGIADTVDAYVASLLYDAVNGTANDYGAFTADISDKTAYNLFVELRTILNRANVPSDGRYVVVPPEVTAALLQDDRFTDASKANTDQALRNGEVGRIAGFTVYESNQTPDPTSGTYAVIAGHPIATTFVEQINKVEAIRLEGSFSDGVRGLTLYGGKVVRPAGLALASVTVQA